MSKVIVIDDNMVNRTLAKTYLRRANIYSEILEAEDGDIGLQMIIEDEDIEIVLLDIYMPRMNGFEVLSSLKEKGISRKVIVLSTDDEQKEKVIEMGANEFLSKPIKEVELLEVLNKIK